MAISSYTGQRVQPRGVQAPGKSSRSKGNACLSRLGAFPEALKNCWSFVIPAVHSHPVLMLLAASPGLTLPLAPPR